MAWFSGFSTFGQVTLHMGVFIRSMGRKVIFWVPSFGGLGAMMTFKKDEMAKILMNGFKYD